MEHKKSLTAWNKGRKYAVPRKCDYCISFEKVYFNRKINGLVCSKHHWHVKKHGRILSEEECIENLKRSQSGWIGRTPWNYKGGRATLNMVIRRCQKYKKWVKGIFARDNFTCQKCSVRGTYLEADHYPVRFSTIMDEEGIKSYEQALACERLWDESNGRTLCRTCHRFKKQSDHLIAERPIDEFFDGLLANDKKA